MPATPDDLVRLERHGDVALVVLNDGARLNPMSMPLQEGLRARLAEAAADNSYRALVLTGDGRGFCVGADLSAISNPGEGGDTRSMGERTAETMEALSNRIVLDLQALPMPVVCAINGAAAGAGAGIALAGDFALLADSAYFYFPFLPKLGIVPDLGSTWFLERRVGRARAMSLMLMGERLSAQQAVDWGLAWGRVADAELREQALSLAARLAKLPAHAVIEARRALDAAGSNTLAQQLSYEASRQRELVGGPDFMEGVKAFAQKREPVFASRK